MTKTEKPVAISFVQENLSQSMLALYLLESQKGLVMLHYIHCIQVLHIWGMLHMWVIFGHCFLAQRNCFLLLSNNYFW